LFIAALSTIAKLWNQPRCPTADERIKKMWYLYTMEFHSARKKNEILLFAGKRMELEICGEWIMRTGHKHSCAQCSVG
jgi:hypothetical protein